MRLLKQLTCLALLGAGLTAVSTAGPVGGDEAHGNPPCESVHKASCARTAPASLPDRHDQVDGGPDLLRVLVQVKGERVGRNILA